jgi:hypothetical protein
MENMEKGLTAPKWVLTVWPKIHPPNLSAQAQKFGILMKKRLHWVSEVRGLAGQSKNGISRRKFHKD